MKFDFKIIKFAILATRSEDNYSCKHTSAKTVLEKFASDHNKYVRYVPRARQNVAPDCPCSFFHVIRPILHHTIKRCKKFVVRQAQRRLTAGLGLG